MVVLELVSAMQGCVSTTVLPLLAASLGGTRLYGTASGAVQAAVLLTLPLAPWLTRRWSAAGVLTVLTPLSVVLSVAAAAATSMGWWILARFLGGLCSGALAGVGMGIVAGRLAGRARQLVLAANNLVWVLASLAGPAWAGWLSAILSWRWALVGHLPLLIAARWVIVVHLRHHPAMAPDVSRRLVAPWRGALLLAASVFLLGLRPPVDAPGVVMVVLGMVGAVVGARAVLPGAVWRRRAQGSPAALGLLACLSVMHLGSEAVVAIVAHDELGMGPRGLAWLLMAGGLAWSLLGLVTGAHPAGPWRARRQLPLALVVVGAGLVVMTLAAGRASFSSGWVVVNLGMGLGYLDCLAAVYGGAGAAELGPELLGASAALVESLGAAVAGTLAAGVVAADPRAARWVFAVLALAVLPGLERAGASWPSRSASITA